MRREDCTGAPVGTVPAMTDNMDELDQHDDSAEGGALDPEGEGGRQPGGMLGDAAEGERDERLQEEQQGKGYGAG